VDKGENALTGGEITFRSMPGWRKTGSAGVIIVLLTSEKIEYNICPQKSKQAKRMFG
jgi:hypothetical protein